MSDEHVNKRRRVSHYEPASDDFLSSFLPTPTTENHPGIGLDHIPVDPFLSPATSWGFDELAHDPGYLASQEEFRSLLFNTARSAAPTRAGSPAEEEDQTIGDASFNIKQVLASGRRVQYLKNYISQVAPWVSLYYNGSQFGLATP